MAEILINLDKVTVSLSGTVIFADLDWELQMGQRVGLVGPNGAGKSTLFKLITSELPLDAGNVFRKTGIHIARLPQEPELPPGKTVLDEAITAVPTLSIVTLSITHAMNNKALVWITQMINMRITGLLKNGVLRSFMIFSSCRNFLRKRPFSH